MSSDSQAAMGTIQVSVAVLDSSATESDSIGGSYCLLTNANKITNFGTDFKSTSVVIDTNPPENSMLNSKKLSILRPELLAVLDFQSVKKEEFYEGTDQNTKLFYERITKRKMQEESALSALTVAAAADPDNYTIALSQYESALASAASEIALLKIAFVFKKYAELGPSFTSFINHYVFDLESFTSEEINLSDIGETYITYMNKTMCWEQNPGITSSKIQNGYDATLFLQLINDLSFSCALATPKLGLFSDTRLGNNSGDVSTGLRDFDSRIHNIWNKNDQQGLTGTTSINSGVVGLVRICRDLTASMQIGRIAAAEGDENETLKIAIEKYANSDYFSSSTKPSRTLFGSVVGWDPFAAAVSDSSKVDSNSTRYYYVSDFAAYTNGLVSELFTSDQATVMVSNDSDTYINSAPIGETGFGKVKGTDYTVPTKQFAGVQSLVDSAFSADGGLDLGLYGSQISSFQDNLEDFSYIYSQLFKLLEYRGDVLGDGLGEKTYPTSPLNFYAKVLQITNTRLHKKAPTYIGLEPEALAEATSTEEFYQAWGVLFMLKKPDVCKVILEKFVDDYLKGYLTFSGETTVIETTDDAGTVTESEVQDNVKPGTTTAVDLGNSRGSLYSYLQQLYVDEASSTASVDSTLNGFGASTASDWTSFGYGSYQLPIWQPLSPTSVFAGTALSEKIKSQYADALGITGNPYSRDGTQEATEAFENEIQILYAWQQAGCMWQGINGVTYPTGIISVAAGVIDAVMTVLYDTMSPILEISSTSASDPYFPAVESRSPPYHKQYFTFVEGADANPMNLVYPAGMGALSTMNTQYWVPVLEAIRTSVMRSEDKTTFYSGTPMSKVLTGIVDAFNSAAPQGSAEYGVEYGGNASGNSSGNCPATLICSRDDPTALAVPYWSGGNTTMNASAIYPATGMSDNTDWAQLAIGGATLLTFTGDGIAALVETAAGEVENPPTLSDSSWGGMESTDYDNIIGIAANLLRADHTFATAGWGVYLFGTMENAMVHGSGVWSDDADLEGTYDGRDTASTPSQLLNKVRGADDWEAAFASLIAQQADIIALLEEIDTTADGSFEIGSTDQADFAAARDEIIEFFEFFATMVNFIDLSDVPAPIWYMLNMAGFDQSITSYTPLGFMLTEVTMDEIAIEYENAYIKSNDDGLGKILNITKNCWINDSLYGDGKVSTELYQLAGKLLNYRSEDIRLGVGFDMMAKYSQRIADYAETAIDGLTTEGGSDSSALEVLIAELCETSAGIDVMQNLTEAQLNLKTAGLERQKGNDAYGYISKSEIIQDEEIAAIKLMLETDPLLTSEGRNIKTAIVGLPAGMLEAVYSTLPEADQYHGPMGTDLGSGSDSVKPQRSPLFGVKVSASIPDHPLFHVIPKLYRFDSELFVLPGAFADIDFEDPELQFLDVVKATKFTRIRFETREASSDSSDPIVKIDSSQEEIYNDVTIEGNTWMLDIYSNTLASFLLEKYYKLMVGLASSEDDLTTAGGGLEIPINDYAADFAAALGSIYTDLESDLEASKIESLFMPSDDIESISYSALTPSAASNKSINTYSTMVSEFSSEIAAGEFADVESSLFEGFTNAASSRLFSAESMRDKILGANYFDRVVYILADPDEFLIASFPALEYAAMSASDTAFNENYETLYRTLTEQLIEKGQLEYVDRDFDGSGQMDTDDQGASFYLKLTTKPDEGELSFAQMYYSFVRDGDHHDKKNFGVYLQPHTTAHYMIATHSDFDEEV